MLFMTLLRLDQNYQQFLQQLKDKIHTTQMRAMLAVNQAQLQLYWHIGMQIIKKQQQAQWGSHFLEQLSTDLRQAFPGMQGWSVTNLKRMRLFAECYPEKRPRVVDQLPWGTLSTLLHRIKDTAQRIWYAEQTLLHGWSRTILELQIESGLYDRQAENEKKITNFAEHLPQPQSDLARDMLKDPYKFDFLTLQDKAHEREIERALVSHIRDFLLELGQGFSFVGSQIPLIFDEQEFFIDMLFYHLNLRCYVVIELKATDFKPAHTGQLGFYLAAVDKQLRKEGDNRTIGLLLCKNRNKIIAEYALSNINAPIGISSYELTKAIPDTLKLSLPTVEELESELNQLEGKP